MNKEILNDWIGDRNKSFVHVRKSGRECWEDSLEGRNLSSAFAAREFNTLEEFLTKTYSVADETIRSMDTDHKVKINIGGSMSCTDFEQVFVATDYIDDESLSTMDKADIFIGLAVHEASHLLYTEKIRASDKFTQTLLNVLEDERIERKLGDEKPGVANFLGPVKDYYFGAMDKKMGKKEKADALTEFTTLLLSIIRYPKDIDKSLVDKYEKYLIECKEVLTPYPDSTSKCLEAAEKIKEIIKDLFVKEEEEKREEEKKHESDKREDDTKDAGDESKSEPDFWSGPESESKSEGKSGHESRDERGSTGRSEGVSDKTESSGGSEELSSGYDGSREAESDSTGVCEVDDIEAFEEAVSELGETLSGMIEKGAPRSEHISRKMYGKDVDMDVVSGDVTRGSSDDVFFYESVPQDKKQYDICYAEIKKFIPAMSRAIRGFSEERSTLFSGLREGHLDTHKLSQAVQGDQNIYKKMFTQKVEKMTVCLLVDESGSMIREGRIKSARNAAILINEALSKQKNINLYIYGHSADEKHNGTTDLRVYREGNKSNKYKLGLLSARDNNRDGTAILEVAKRVRRFTDENVLMIVLSDGAPAADRYFGPSAIADTKKKVEEAEKMGFKIVQVCINACYDPALMFKRYLTLENLSTLAKDLGKVVTKALTEKKRIRTTTT